MDIYKKIEQFSLVVFKEAKQEQHDILNRVSDEYEKACDDYTKSAKNKFDRRFEEERNRVLRENQKKVVVAQTEFKKELMAKRTGQEKNIFFNVEKKLHEYVNTEQYLNSLLKEIKKNKPNDYKAIVYLVSRDMKYKEKIENEAGVLVEQSKEDFIGGFKITIGENKILDCSYESKLSEAKKTFNKIKIF